MLDAVLSVYQIPEKEIEYVYIPVYQPAEAISEAVRGFNSDTHVIVSKEQLDVTNQLKALTEVAVIVEQAKQKIDELHAVQVGKLFKVIEEKQKPKKPTLKQQREQKEKEQEILIENLRNNAMRRKLNGL